MTALAVRNLTTAALDDIPEETHRNHSHKCFLLGLHQWLELHPELEEWEAWEPGHVLEFHDWLIRVRGLKRSTAAQYINPLRLAARRVALYHPRETKQLFLRRMIARPEVAPARFLMADQLAELVATAREKGDAPGLLGFVIGATTGLRINEVCALQGRDFDGQNITVRESKTQAGVRVLPCCTQAAHALTICFSLWPAFPVSRPDTLSHYARGHLDDTADRTGDESYRLCNFYEATRKTFTQLALFGDAEAKYVQAYIGHAPAEVFERHYAALTPRPDDMPRVRGAKIGQMRKRVVAAVEKSLTDAGANLFPVGGAAPVAVVATP